LKYLKNIKSSWNLSELIVLKTLKRNIKKLEHPEKLPLIVLFGNGRLFLNVLIFRHKSL